MSRYRQTGLNGAYVYQLSGVINDGLQVAFPIPIYAYERLYNKSESVITREVIESIRLIADETAGGVALCSTGLKAQVRDVSLINNGIPAVILSLDYPTGAVKTGDGTTSGKKWITYTITKYGITKTYTLRESDMLTIEMDWGEDPDMTEKAIEKATEHIMGGAVPFNTREDIPAILWNDEYADINGEGELMTYANIQPPVIMGVGSIVRAEEMTAQTEDMFYVAKAVNNPSIGYDGQDYSITGATWMLVENGKSYICTSVVPLTLTHDNEEHSGKLYVYAEYDPGVSNKELRDLINSKSAADKAALKQEMRNIAGNCIFPDFEWPCLPFDKPNGFSALDNDLDIYTGDFEPQMGSEAAKLFVGAIIKVTGDCVIEDETYSFPAGTSLSVAKAVSSDQAGYEQGLYWNFQENSELAGVTQTIQPQKDHYYRVTGFHDVYDMTNLETVEGYVITYEEVDLQSISDLVKRAAEKLLSEYRESAGSMIIATSAEYAAFKSHMQTQIANILTPILEAE